MRLETIIGRRVLLILAFVYGGFVLALHVVPTGAVSVSGGHLGNTIRFSHFIHMAMFFPWGLIITYLVYSRHGHRVRCAIIWSGIALGLAVGAEMIQVFLPYRSFKAIDLIANVIGVFFGYLSFAVWHIYQYNMFREKKMKEKSNSKRRGWIFSE